jgi:hypothetical protein
VGWAQAWLAISGWPTAAAGITVPISAGATCGPDRNGAQHHGADQSDGDALEIDIVETEHDESPLIPWPPLPRPCSVIFKRRAKLRTWRKSGVSGCNWTGET